MECLALVILLDQFPRLIYISYASNQAEIKAAKEKIGHMDQTAKKISHFFYSFARAVGIGFIPLVLRVRILND